MNYTRKTVKLHGGQAVFVLIPKTVCTFITASEMKGHYFVFSNGTGYDVLKDVISSACILEENEIIYMPLNFGFMDAYLSDFTEPENHFKGLLFMNYSTSRFNAKDIITAIKTRKSQLDLVTRAHTFSRDWVENWKTSSRLTVRPAGTQLIFSANRDVFTGLAQSCERLSEYGDCRKYNQYPAHMHHDWNENTAKSVGITFYYWMPPEKAGA